MQKFQKLFKNPKFFDALHPLASLCQSRRATWEVDTWVTTYYPQAQNKLLVDQLPSFNYKSTKLRSLIIL